MRKLCLAALLASACGMSQAAVITFEDAGIPAGNGYAPISNGYAGLDWNNFDVIDGTLYPGYGYDTGVVSGNNAAFNLNGAPAVISAPSSAGFNLEGGYFTAAYTVAYVTAAAVFKDGTTSSVTFAVDATGPVHEVFGWNGLASVTFSALATPVPGSAATAFVVDDLAAVAAVPEPACAALMLAGLGMVGIARRRRCQVPSAV